VNGATSIDAGVSKVHVSSRVDHEDERVALKREPRLVRPTISRVGAVSCFESWTNSMVDNLPYWAQEPAFLGFENRAS
jgi:hypothetical protein